MTPTPGPPALRRLALSLAVLHDVDLVPTDEGVLLAPEGPGGPLPVAWSELRRALAGADPEGSTGRARALAHVRGRRVVAARTAEELAALARPVGLPTASPFHPGLDWVQERVLGDTLDLGLGLVGVSGDPDEVVVLPDACYRAAGVDASAWWPAAHAYLERMGAVAAERLAGQPGGVLRPIGDCDVVTLLGSRTFRTALAGRDGSGLCPAVVPMRSRGWVDVRRVDPAYASAAAAAAGDTGRAFDRPLLLTADEVVLAAEGGRPLVIELRDPAPAEPVRPGWV